MIFLNRFGWQTNLTASFIITQCRFKSQEAVTTRPSFFCFFRVICQPEAGIILPPLHAHGKIHNSGKRGGGDVFLHSCCTGLNFLVLAHRVHGGGSFVRAMFFVWAVGS